MVQAHDRAAGAGPAIRLEELTKDYGQLRALDGVDLEVARGELFGFLGPNGAGKTTAIRILLDFIRPTSGRAEVLGFDAQRQPIEVHRRVGYLPGDLRLYERLTAAELLDHVEALRGGRVDPRYRDEIVERLGLDVSRRIGQLSSGNRQKVGLVLAMMPRPEVLVMDEPTIGLDPLVQEEVERLLREASSDGAAVFFSSHVLSEVEQLCDRAAMLRAGRIIEIANLSERRRLAPQRLRVTFAGATGRDELDGIRGARLVSLDGRTAVFEIEASPDPLIKRLGAFHVEHIETEQPGLEELFLSYYAADDGRARPLPAAGGNGDA